MYNSPSMVKGRAGRWLPCGAPVDQSEPLQDEHFAGADYEVLATSVSVNGGTVTINLHISCHHNSDVLRAVRWHHVQPRSIVLERA